MYDARIKERREREGGGRGKGRIKVETGKEREGGRGREGGRYTHINSGWNRWIRAHRASPSLQEVERSLTWIPYPST